MSIDRRLHEIATLEENWDGYCAPPVSRKAIEAAGGLEFCPCGDGSLIIELYLPGSEFHVDIDTEGCISNVSLEWKKNNK